MLRFFLMGFLAVVACRNVPQKVDVVVYGATSSGIMAAYTAKMQGKTVALLEASTHLGGLTTGGLGQTDIGNKYAITGLSRDFYRKVGAHYGKLEQWTFEPKVAKRIFEEYLNTAGVEVAFSEELVAVNKQGERIHSIQTKNALSGKTKEVFGTVFIDATYEGDLMALAGVSYTVGREANQLYGEHFNGVQLMDKHQFPDGVDPYTYPGKPESGLLWGISKDSLAIRGSEGAKVQAYNFRLCLTDSLENQIPFTRPEGYDSSRFELLLRYLEKKPAKELNWALMHIQPMPNRKTDINNSGPFSTDYIGANYAYAEASYAERKKILADHRHYTESLLYFLAYDSRVPEHLRNEMKHYGWAKDEFVDHGNFTPQLYVREARRMVSDYVMTEHHCVGNVKVKDGIGMAAYTMDSHNTQRIVVNGMVKNEGDVQEGLGGLPPYPIAYRSIIPKEAECSNLIVPVCLSASHIAFGSIRMEPVFMVLGQSAGMAAVLAPHGNVHEVNVSQLNEKLKQDPTSDGKAAAIYMDNESDGVTTSGNWLSEKSYRGKYGINTLVAQSPKASIRFEPNYTAESLYDLYIYLPQKEGCSSFKINGKGFLFPNNADWHLVGTVDPNEVIEIKAATGALMDAICLIPNK